MDFNPDSQWFAVVCNHGGKFFYEKSQTNFAVAGAGAGANGVADGGGGDGGLHVVFEQSLEMPPEGVREVIVRRDGVVGAAGHAEVFEDSYGRVVQRHGHGGHRKHS